MKPLSQKQYAHVADILLNGFNSAKADARPKSVEAITLATAFQEMGLEYEFNRNKNYDQYRLIDVRPEKGKALTKAFSPCIGILRSNEDRESKKTLLICTLEEVGFVQHHFGTLCSTPK